MSRAPARVSGVPTGNPSQLTRVAFAIAFVCLLTTFGCERNEEIVSYQAPKEAEKPPHAPAPMDAMTAMPASDAQPRWTAPPGWKELPAGGMRAAAFQAPDDPKMELTVVPLGPGLPLLANVNRWENQIGLPPSDEQVLAKLLKQIDVNGVRFQTLELTGPESANPRQSILAAFVERPDKTWYFKLQGAADKIAGHKAEFDAFVKSVRFGESQPTEAAKPQAAVEGAPPSTGAEDVKWTVPQGWVQEPPRQMRVASFKTSLAPDAAQVIVSRFGAGAFGGMLDNINRWRGMVNLPPIDDVKKQPGEKTKIGGADADAYEFVNDGQRLVVILIPRGEMTWFIRFVGTDKETTTQKPSFDAFLRSIQW
jgi:hypothetical protein